MSTAAHNVQKLKSLVSKQFGRNTHPNYVDDVIWRFTELYEGITQKQAEHAIRCGYSSPSAAMDDGIIPPRLAGLSSHGINITYGISENADRSNQILQHLQGVWIHSASKFRR